jgi:hypothetical protein
VCEKGEKCRVYILRKQDCAKWETSAARGEENARLCVFAVGNFYRLMAKEPSWCACCETLFIAGDIPQAFIVLIPVDITENILARAFAVCVECSKQEDPWLIDQSVLRKGLAPTTARPGDKIH